jgi:plasmid stabilization system protein ParE
VASGEIADKLLREISEAGERLADEALMWRVRDEVMPGLRSVLGPSVHNLLPRARWRRRDRSRAA